MKRSGVVLLAFLLAGCAASRSGDDPPTPVDAPSLPVDDAGAPLPPGVTLPDDAGDGEDDPPPMMDGEEATSALPTGGAWFAGDDAFVASLHDPSFYAPPAPAARAGRIVLARVASTRAAGARIERMRTALEAVGVREDAVVTWHAYDALTPPSEGVPAWHARVRCPVANEACFEGETDPEVGDPELRFPAGTRDLEARARMRHVLITPDPGLLTVPRVVTDRTVTPAHVLVVTGAPVVEAARDRSVFTRGYGSSGRGFWEDARVRVTSVADGPGPHWTPYTAFLDALRFDEAVVAVWGVAGREPDTFSLARSSPWCGEAADNCFVVIAERGARAAALEPALAAARLGAVAWYVFQLPGHDTHRDVVATLRSCARLGRDAPDEVYGRGVLTLDCDAIAGAEAMRAEALIDLEMPAGMEVPEGTMSAASFARGDAWASSRALGSLGDDWTASWVARANTRARAVGVSLAAGPVRVSALSGLGASALGVSAPGAGGGMRAFAQVRGSLMLHDASDARVALMASAGAAADAVEARSLRLGASWTRDWGSDAGVTLYAGRVAGTATLRLPGGAEARARRVRARASGNEVRLTASWRF